MPETSRPVHYREYMRYFNTSGRCVPGLHYMLPPEPRLPDALELTPDPITAVHVDQAKERLTPAQTTHLDYLAARLEESRVQRVIAPLLANSFPANSGLGHADDVSYVRDLGLIAERPPIRVANPIYKELIVRSLSGREITLLTA